MNTINTTQIVKDLISLPSYVDAHTNESAAAEYVINYLAQFPFLQVEKQPVAPGRYNVLARSPGRPRLLLAGHLDTVQPKQGWSRSQLQTEGSKLYGLGSADMKGGIAAILAALGEISDPAGLSLLFYCDEEYDFAGMRTFIARQGRTQPAQLAVVAEASDLKLCNAAQGLIELTIAVRGRAGHAGSPESGINAIIGLSAVLTGLQSWLGHYHQAGMGTPTLNVAYFSGGLDLGGEPRRLGREGNNIPDYAEAVLDIRTSSNHLRSQVVKEWLSEAVTAQGLKLEKYETRHDLGTLSTDKTDLSEVEQAVKSVVGKAEYLDAQGQGYGDGQLLQEKYGIPVIHLGPIGGHSHGLDEWVDTASIDQARQIYTRIIQSYCA